MYVCMYVLHCIALHCIALHCIALHCIALHCIVLYCIVLYYCKYVTSGHALLRHSTYLSRSLKCDTEVSFHHDKIAAKRLASPINSLKCYYDKNRIFQIWAILRHKLIVCTRVKMLFTIFKNLFSFQRYSSFQYMPISQVMTSYTQPNFDQMW